VSICKGLSKVIKQGKMTIMDMNKLLANLTNKLHSLVSDTKINNKNQTKHNNTMKMKEIG